MSSYGYLFLLLFSEESESKEQQLQNISRWFPTPKCSIKEGAKQVLYDDVCAAEVSTTTWTMIIIMIMRDGCSSRNFFPDITQSCIFIRLLVFKLNSRIIPRIPGLFILFTKRGENPLRVCKNSTSVSLSLFLVMQQPSHMNMETNMETRSSLTDWELFKKEKEEGDQKGGDFTLIYLTNV